MKINMGCGWRNFGKDWIHIDNGDYEHLDYKCDISKKLPFENNSVDLIYASHVIAYFDNVEILKVLKEWKRILKLNGKLRIATPDFESINELYASGDHKLTSFLGPIYGKMKMGNEVIYHKTIYDFKIITNILESAGFKNIKKYEWRETEHACFDDHSQAYIPHMDKENGKLISLNVECIKQ